MFRHRSSNLRYELNTDLLNASADISEGIMYSANHGFLHYIPELEDQIGIQRPLVVKRLRNVTQGTNLVTQLPFTERSTASRAIVVNQRAKVLQFDIESFQFRNKNNQQFRYLLKGFDDDFSNWTDITTKEYTNLREGNYTFVAQTRNYQGAITESLPLNLLVRPPFHRSLLAKLIYLVAGFF